MSGLRWLTIKQSWAVPPITAVDVEAVIRELWAEIEPEPPNRIVMRREAFEMMRAAYRSGVRRRQRQRTLRPRHGMLRRGVAVREREGKFERFSRRYGR